MPYFFFSYARENRRNADRERPDGSTFNLVDQFFDRLSECLSEVTGMNSREIGYRDLSALQIGAPWPLELVQAMQKFQVLVALISPHYLRSINCRREFEVFVRRFATLENDMDPIKLPSRIIPVFWVNADQCWAYATAQAKQFLEKFNLTGPGFPDEYPSVGLRRLRLLGRPQVYEAICLHLADRIKELAESEPLLPVLDGIADFRDLPSAFDATQRNDKAVEPMLAPVFNLGDMPPPAGVIAGPAPPGLHLVP